ADKAQSSRVPVPLPKDPYEAIRQACLVGTDNESEPFKGEDKTPKSPHIVPPPTCHVEESEGSGTSVWKRYKGTFELIMGTDSEEDEEVEKSSDFNSESEDREDEGPTAEDEDPAVGDEDDEGHSVESGGFGLGEEEAVHEGQQRVVPVVGIAIDPKDDMVYIDVPVYPPQAPPLQKPCSPEWTSGSLPISPSPSIVPSPMISLTVPSSIASHVATSTATIPVDEDQFIEVGAQLKLYKSILQDHTQHLDVMPSTLSLEHKLERTAMTFGALWRPVLALEAWVGRVDTQRELQEMRGRVTVLELERGRKER
nr:hypothetical protein [Tanacetum cinerariifolium]